MIDIRYMSLTENERFNLSQYPSTDYLLSDLRTNATTIVFPVISGNRIYNVSEQVYKEAHAYCLWDRKYTPSEITPEIIRELDIQGALKLLHWKDKFYAEEAKKNY